jgi:TM2 domain-containing membrane protein YozV
MLESINQQTEAISGHHPRPADASVKQLASEAITNFHQLIDAVRAGNFISAIGALSSKDQAIYNAEVERRKRSTGIAYLFYFLLWWCGAHKFYLTDRNWGFAYVLFPVIGVISLPLGLWLALPICFAVLLIAAAFDLFCIPAHVRKANDKIRLEILEDLSSEGPKKRDGLMDSPAMWWLPTKRF